MGQIRHGSASTMYAIRAHIQRPQASVAALSREFEASGGGRAYARIVAGLIVGSERDQALVRENYDATAKEFIRVLRCCIPHISIIEATQIYISALGVMATSLAPDGRAARLAERDVTQEDSIVIKHLIRFAVGGARAFQNK